MLLCDLVGERQLHHGSPWSERFWPRAALDRPKQQSEVDLVFSQGATRPSLAPSPEREDDGSEFLAGRCQVIGPASPARRFAPLHDAFPLKLLEPV